MDNMEREKLEALIIDYIDNRLNSAERKVVEQELVKNPEAFKLHEELREVMHLMDKSARFEPSTQLQSSFENMLASEIKAAEKTKTVFFNPAFYRVAAAIALLVLGGG